MSRQSINQLTKEGTLWNGYDYENQAWVINGIYQDCGHPAGGTIILGERFTSCDCYGREHAGQRCTTSGGQV